MNILFLCTYPIEKPRHGGQLRVRNIVDTYRAAGHQVNVVGVLGGESYEKEKGFLAFPGILALKILVPNILFMEDYALGQIFVNDSKYYNKLAELITTQPDIIHVEQPWLVGFAHRYVIETQKNIKIIYGSQNIEWQLKQQILSAVTDSAIYLKNIELIKKVELEAIACADATVAVSQSDAEWIRSVSSKPVVLAPNGVKPWNVTAEKRREAAQITQGYNYALYCASGHPPNVTGFFDMLAGGFGSLKPDEKLVIAGSAGILIAEDIRIKQFAKFAEKIIVAGIVTQSCLDGLLDGAKCIILPLTQGGGTNLKTAEALWAAKNIVATNTAMRGFEHFISSSGVTVANDSITFKRALRDSMNAPDLLLTNKEIDERKTVLWESCLAPLQDLLKNLSLDHGVI